MDSKGGWGQISPLRFYEPPVEMTGALGMTSRCLDRLDMTEGAFDMTGGRIKKRKI